MRIVRLFRHLAAVGIAVLVSSTAIAQNYYLGNEQTVTVSEATFNDMSQRLQALEASFGAQKDMAAGKDGWKDTSTQGWTHTWGGRIMGDYVMKANQDTAHAAKFAGPDSVQNYFEFRQLRLHVEGEGYGIYDYQFEVDFEPEADIDQGIDDPYVAIRDMYFGIHEVPFLGYVAFGNMKAPYSIEEMTSSRYITFMERALPNIFAPQRQVGVTAFNHSPDKNWTWAGGIYFDQIHDGFKQFGSMAGAATTPAGAAVESAEGTLGGDAQGTTLAGRLTWTPYYDEPSDGRYLLHVGINGRYTEDKNDILRWQARPEIHEGDRYIDTGLFLGDDYTVMGPEVALVWGPFSFQAEYTYVNADPSNLDREFHGAYAYASYFLTGENRVYDRTKSRFERLRPYTNFWVVRGAGIGPGAVEVATRWSYLDLSYMADNESGQQNDFTLGLNWYWNPNTRWMLNYIHTWNEYTSGPFTDAESSILAMRGQIDF